MGKLIFITGGVRSGKSGFAETYAQSIAEVEQRTPVYIATGVAFDQEMRQRISRHQQDRANSTFQWATFELPVDIQPYTKEQRPTDIVLFECVTTWLSNIYYETESLEPIEQEKQRNNWLDLFKQSLLQWRSEGIVAIIVSNEVLDDGVSLYEETALYQQTVGEMHQWLVRHCDEAYEVNAQIIERWK